MVGNLWGYLDETAFSFPHLVSGEDGEVRLEFTMPEALTQWKFLGFAHDRELRAGLLTDSMVTAKDLMVQPNPPRFLREGDVLEFDDNRLSDELGRAMHQWAEMQRADGTWPWFPGGRPNDYITLRITTGFGRLCHLGVDPAVKALARLENWIDEIYRRILERGHKDRNNLSPTIALYLNGRRLFLEDKPIDAKHREAVDYFLGQAREHWLGLASRKSQAHLAVALDRFGDRETAKGIMRSIKERSVTDEELGRFWRELELSWWWFRAPIETQAMMIEAFDEVMNDAEAVEECSSTATRKAWQSKSSSWQSGRRGKGNLHIGRRHGNRWTHV